MAIQSGILKLVSRAVSYHHTTHLPQRKLKTVSHGGIPFTREEGTDEEVLRCSLLHLLLATLGRFAHVSTMAS